MLEVTILEAINFGGCGLGGYECSSFLSDRSASRVHLLVGVGEVTGCVLDDSGRRLLPGAVRTSVYETLHLRRSVRNPGLVTTKNILGLAVTVISLLTVNVHHVWLPNVNTTVRCLRG